MQVGEILDRKGHQVFAVRPEWTLREVAAVIARRNIGTTVVTDPKGGLLGIVSERDIVRALSEAGAGVFELSVGAVMTAAVVTCSPETTVGEALSLMASHRIRHLPVVRDTAVIGLISIRDILEFRLESLEESFAAMLRGKREASISRAADERAQHAKAEFLAGLSDKLKPPLHMIADLADYLGETLFDITGGAGHLPNIAAIGANGRAALEILDNALDLARIDSNEREPSTDDVAVAELIAACVETARATTSDKELTLAVEPGNPVPPLTADRRMLRQMIDQLLSNAIKFTPSGGTVSLACRADTDGGIRIVVTDSGIGMAPEQLAKVTRPFYQIERLTRRTSDSGEFGAGLGLALVDAMVRAHHGTLQLESRVGIGTVVTLRFPPPRPTLAEQAEAAD
jgi:two-component system, cell cycle sensor histidine kinase PleC